MSRLDTIFGGLHNSASSLLRLRRNIFADDFQLFSTLFNNETADKCGRLVKAQPARKVVQGLTPRTLPTALAELKSSVLTQWKRE
jgi:hypothetical protein